MSLLWLLLGYFGHATSARRDSLIQESLKNTRNPEVLAPLAEEMMQFDDAEMKARAFFVKGLAYNYGAKPHLSAKSYWRALQFMEQGQDFDQRFTYPTVLRNLGIAYYRSQQYERGDSAFIALRTYALEYQDSLSYALSLKSISGAMLTRGKYDTAVSLMKRALEIYEQMEYRGIPLAYMSMGSVFGRMGQPGEALNWFRKALSRMNQMPDRRTEGRILNNMAVAHREMAQLDSAQVYLKQALSIQEDLGSIFDQVEIRGNLARNAISLEHFEAAELYLKEAMAQVDTNNPRSSQVLQNIFVLQFDLAIMQGDEKEAERWMGKLKARMGMAQLLKSYEMLERLSNYHEIMGRQDSALFYLKRSEELKEQLKRDQDATAIKKMANDVELIGLKSEQDKLQSRIRQVLLFAGGALIFLLIGFWYYWRSQKRIQAKQATQEPEWANGAQFRFEDRSNLVEPRPAVAPKTGLAQLKLKSKAVINILDIIYAQSEGHYLNIFIEGKSNPEVDRSSLKALQEELEAHNFQRIHRSYVVNCDRLKAVYSTKVLLENGVELPVSRTYKEELQARFSEKDKS